RVPQGLEIDADPEQLFRVLLNLCRNAVQALDGDQNPAVVRRLTVSAKREAHTSSIRVADTGPGVPLAARAHLFQAFQGSARPGGTGLGLAIAAEIIRAHGGTIALVEAVGPGAIFELSVPDRPGRGGRNGRTPPA
ncbi:MAG: HAMP domain-containing histidine kinase, partial [Rhizobiales bacterium]|nr:HAMP domain-containing histidine kinase [Hyphomicrobiales bacterium]